MFILAALLTDSIVKGASYEMLERIFVDPILDSFGHIHRYSRPNLEHFANLTGWRISEILAFPRDGVDLDK